MASRRPWRQSLAALLSFLLFGSAGCPRTAIEDPFESAAARDAATGQTSNSPARTDPPAHDPNAPLEDDAGNLIQDPAAPDGPAIVYTGGTGGEIRVFDFDPGRGALSANSTVTPGGQPSYLAVAPDRRHLYAIDEAEGTASTLIAYAIDPQSGALTEIDREPSGGDGAPYLSVHPSGHWVVVTHGSSGHIGVLPIAEDGTLEPLVDLDKGPNDTCELAAQAVFDRSGLHLLVPCLASNYLIQFGFDNGQLRYAEPSTVAVTGGPRHLAFDPSGRHVYVLSESESFITWFDYDAAKGTLSNPQTVNAYEEEPGASAHIVVHASGRFLYVSNGTENSLGLFALDDSGRPSAQAFVRDQIETPRDFSVDPSGRWLILMNQTGAQTGHLYAITRQGVPVRTQIFEVGAAPTYAGVVVLD